MRGDGRACPAARRPAHFTSRNRLHRRGRLGTCPLTLGQGWSRSSAIEDGFVTKARGDRAQKGHDARAAASASRLDHGRGRAATTTTSHRTRSDRVRQRLLQLCQCCCGSEMIRPSSTSASPRRSDARPCQSAADNSALDGTSLPAARAVRVRGHREGTDRRPEASVVDNGPEFPSAIFSRWAEVNGGEVRHLQPGRPMQNVFSGVSSAAGATSV